MDSFDEFVERLRGVKRMGYVESHRSGNTGIGKTLEDLLGIEENNIPGPDAAGIELKATREQSQNLTTLFTKEPPRDQRRLWNQDLVRKLGYTDDKDREALKVTVRPDVPNNQGFYLEYDPSSVAVSHDEYGVCATYPFSYLQDTFEGKMPSFAMVFADVREVNGTEHFWYNRAYHLGGFDGDDFLDLMRDGVVTLDLRMHIKENGNIRNRGTAWRIMEERRLDEVFAERTPLLDDTEVDDLDVAPRPHTPAHEQESLDDYQ